jgi:uncharacterized RDD family membrane protein YckC
MFCPNCGSENSDRALFCQACGTTFGVKPATGFTLQASGYAGFWARFVAILIDTVIIAIGTGLVSAITLGAGVIVSLCGPWLYEAFMMSSEWQATVGKRAMSIVVTGLDGGRITFARATGRHFAKYISAFLLGIGFIMAAFTAKKQALHDMIAETLVVNRPN